MSRVRCGPVPIHAPTPEIMNKVSALSLLSNAALAWNTVQIGNLLDGLEARGEAVLSRDVSAGFAARPPPHHPERELTDFGTSGLA